MHYDLADLYKHYTSYITHMHWRQTGLKSGGAEWEFETYLVKFETYSVLRDYETKKTTGAAAPAAPASLAPMCIREAAISIAAASMFQTSGIVHKVLFCEGQRPPPKASYHIPPAKPCIFGKRLKWACAPTSNFTSGVVHLPASWLCKKVLNRTLPDFGL